MTPWWEGLALGWGVCLGVGLWLAVVPTQPTPQAHAPAREEVTRSSGLGALLDRAGLATIRVEVAVGLWCVVAAIAALLVWVVVPIAPLVPMAAVAVTFGGRSLLRSRVAARERRLRHAWPGIVDHIRSAVRSGASVGEAVSLVADRVPGELCDAFATYRSQIAGGTRVDQALAQLKAAVANPVADRIIEALRMSHEVGGRELPSVLQSLQGSIRADISVREDALAKQSWIRAASRLGVAAPWLVLALLSGRPETLQAYSGMAGGAIVVAGAGISVLAYKMMSRLGRLPLEQRWFAS